MTLNEIEKAFNRAILNPENLDDGQINWNFVDADMYMDIKPKKDEVSQFYEIFNELADKFASNNPEMVRYY